MTRPFSMSLLGIVLLGGGFLAGAFLGERVMPRHTGTPDRGQPSETAPSNAVSSLGKLMPSGGLVAVVGPPGDRIEKVFVKAGQAVKAGQELVRLASHDDRREEVALIEIQVREAQRQRQAILAARAAKLAEIDEQVKGLGVTKGAETKAQELKISYLRQQYAAAHSRQERIKGLDTSKVEIGAQEREQVDLAAAQAKTELEAAEGTLEAAKKKNDLQLQAARASRASAEAESDLALLRVPLDSLNKNLALAKIREKRSTLTAPVGGTVVQIVGNEGDPTGAGPILTLAAGAGMVVVAEVYAADIYKLRAAKSLDRIEVEVTGQALGEKMVLHGRIAGSDAIGLSVARNNVVGFSPRSDSDRRVIEVRVELDEESAKRAAKFVGLEVEVKFSIRE
jgi:HlyD family secretion protein